MGRSAQPGVAVVQPGRRECLLGFASARCLSASLLTLRSWQGFPNWPFEETKRAAFVAFSDIYTRTDPAGLPASDYAEPRSKSNANHFTFDISATTLAQFEQRVFGIGHFAQMMPICAPPK